MSGGKEFLFWGLFFVLIALLAVLVEVVERKRQPRSPWLKTFDARSKR
jgi:hypothetical protein